MNLEKARGILFYLVCGFFLGILVDYLITLSVWLEMRVHLNQIVVVFSLLGGVIGFFYRKIRYAVFFLIEILTLIVAMLLGKVELFFYYVKEIFYLEIGVENIKLPTLLILLSINALFFVSYIASKMRKR
ncbi:hypothetical protein [Peptostreptococcus sp. D1]|uniref:hypothetical protein n=1 Tax=Peptostreptococcus sp. D1 TaxID=72304 RepID=UPI0008EA7DBE|nr:hypothetical protein [Peptostreptococcus sp. D1]SFE17280.1 hypothetical protein SAMN02910278_00122 [Peptostreptococcus sp. D1]